MTRSVAIKQNITQLQVLKTLKLLLENSYTMLQLIDCLNKDEKSKVFNNSVVSKYINTCRFCGIEIPKINNRYHVTNMPFGMDISLSELELLEKIQVISRENLTSNFNKKLDIFIEKLNRFSNKNITKVENKTSKLVCEIFDKAVYDKRLVKLMYKNGNILECTPLSIINNKGRLFFEIFNCEKEQLVSIDSLSGIEIMNKRFIKNFCKKVVVYKLKKGLAKRYVLREHEQLIETGNDEIVISNTGENKDILISRLLRYDALCEIISPKDYRNEIKQIINDTLKNYEDGECS